MHHRALAGPRRQAGALERTGAHARAQPYGLGDGERAAVDRRLRARRRPRPADLPPDRPPDRAQRLPVRPRRQRERDLRRRRRRLARLLRSSGGTAGDRLVGARPGLGARRIPLRPRSRMASRRGRGRAQPALHPSGLSHRQPRRDGRLLRRGDGAGAGVRVRERRHRAVQRLGVEPRLHRRPRRASPGRARGGPSLQLPGGRRGRSRRRRGPPAGRGRDDREEGRRRQQARPVRARPRRHAVRVLFRPRAGLRPGDGSRPRRPALSSLAGPRPWPARPGPASSGSRGAASSVNPAPATRSSWAAARTPRAAPNARARWSWC